MSYVEEEHVPVRVHVHVHAMHAMLLPDRRALSRTKNEYMRLSLLPLHALLLLPEVVAAGEAPFVETVLPLHADAAAEMTGGAPRSALPASESTLAGRFLAAVKPKRKFCNTTQYGVRALECLNPPATAGRASDAGSCAPAHDDALCRFALATARSSRATMRTRRAVLSASRRRRPTTASFASVAPAPFAKLAPPRQPLRRSRLPPPRPPPPQRAR